MIKKKSSSNTEASQEETEASDVEKDTIDSKPTKTKAAKTAVKKDSTYTAGFAASAKLVDDMFAKSKKDSPFVPISTASMKQSLPHISTGSFILDYLIGGELNDHGIAPCPGWPSGRIVQLYGPESCGKTTLALMACAEAYRKGMPSVYIDWEHAIVPDYARKLGVPIDDETMFRLYQPNTLEDGIQIAYVYAEHKVPVMIFDSIGFAVPTKEHDRALADRDGSASQPGIVARAWSREIPQLSGILHKSNTLLIAISQLRSSINPGGMGPADTVQGGFVWKFVSSLRLRLKKGPVQEDVKYNPLKGINEKVTVATEIEAKIDKTKLGSSQGRKANFIITFGIGVDNLRTSFELLERNKCVTKKASFYEWIAPDGQLVGGQGKRAFLDAVKTKGLVDPFVGHAKSLLQQAVEKDEDDDELNEEGSESDVDEAIRALD